VGVVDLVVLDRLQLFQEKSAHPDKILATPMTAYSFSCAHCEFAMQ